MNCNEFYNVSGVVLEGEAHPEAYAHLNACPRCRLLVEELGAVERAARALRDAEIEPAGALWARLCAAAEAEGLISQPAGWRWLGLGESWLLPRPALAGALVALMVIAAGLVSFPEGDLPSATVEPLSPIEVAQSELVADASYATRYRIHLQAVEKNVLAQDEGVDPTLRAMLERPLQAVDRAIEQTTSQLNTYPDDQLAREELHRLYQQKATVLQAMSDSTWAIEGR